MNILIMVLSFNESPYKELMQAQQQSWGSVHVPDVDTIYYYGGANKDWYQWVVTPKHPENNSIELQVISTDRYYYMADKFKASLEWLKTNNKNYDIIFRTNSSSYVNKQKLKEFATTLPKEKLYAGWTFHDSNSEDKGKCVSGAGIWLSRDTAEILRNEIDPNFEQEEDVYCGRILRERGIVPIDEKSRIDYTGGLPQQLVIASAEPYHIRFKTGDRLQDAANMKIIHEKIIGGAK